MIELIKSTKLFFASFISILRMSKRKLGSFRGVEFYHLFTQYCIVYFFYEGNWKSKNSAKWDLRFHVSRFSNQKSQKICLMLICFKEIRESERFHRVQTPRRHILTRNYGVHLGDEQVWLFLYMFHVAHRYRWLDSKKNPYQTLRSTQGRKTYARWTRRDHGTVNCKVYERTRARARSTLFWIQNWIKFFSTHISTLLSCY